MKIEDLALRASDLAAQRDFYCRLLGMPELPGTDAEPVIQAGRSRLSFTQAPADWSGFYHLAFNIPENQLAEAKTWLTARLALLTDTAGVDQLHFANWDADSVYFLDPAGNILEFIARHRLGNGSSRPFDAQSILAVDEIGVVTEDVLDTVQLLHQALGIEAHGGSPHDQFTALGDDNGLLIVVKLGRLWLPDMRKAAEPAPLSVRLADQHGAKYRLTGPPYAIQAAD
jgi:catechol-2,3-dioxygenase